ncbi:MAG: T9SS type A sorting domain-containing protein [Ignavibacteria bacterium]
MKKINIIIYLIYTLCFNITYLFSWDSTIAKFYPLQIGNAWHYQRIQYGNNMCNQLPNPTEYTITITGEAIINNKKYYVFSNGYKERIDSVTMNVFRYNGAFDQMLDSLLARKNDHYYGIRLDFFDSYCTVADTFQGNFAGHSGSCKKITVSGNGTNEYYILNGIGVTSMFRCFQNGHKDQLLGCIINGIQYGTISGIENTERIIPGNFDLLQNYPNPFNPTTHFGFRIAKFGLVKLTIYDALGKEVQTLVKSELHPGSYEADWDASAYPSGVYYYKLEVSDPSTPLRVTETKKMVLIK